jgi:hypothetical protein
VHRPIRSAALVVLALTLMLAMALPAAAPAKSPPEHKITVLDDQSNVLATFSSATCGTRRFSDGTSYRYIHARSDAGGDYGLIVDLFGAVRFGHRYTVKLAPTSKHNPFIDVYRGGDQASDSNEWASNNAPPYPVPSEGDVEFSSGGTLVGVAFGPAMFSEDRTNAVQLTGVVRCHKPKKKKTKH